MATKKGSAKKSGVTGAKKSAKKSAKKEARGSGPRELLKTGGPNFYGKRDESGEFSEMDQVGPSQRADRRQRAKKTVKPGYGDQGDQAVRGAPKKGGKKRGGIGPPRKK